MQTTTASKAFLLLLVAAITLTFLSMIKAFIVAVLLAGIFSSLAQPVYRRFTRWFGGRRSAASIVTLAMIMLVIIPFSVLGFLAPEIFKLFPENWEMAGRYTQVLVPWLFMVSLAMPLSFIPDIYKRQKTALLIDLVKFFLRAGALAIGVIRQDVYLSIVLFSGVSTLVILYSLIWYLGLVKRADKTREN